MAKEKYRGNGSPNTDAVCDYLGWSYINALKTMERGGAIYVRGTLLKPSEVKLLQQIDGKMINGKHCKLMNFKN